MKTIALGPWLGENNRRSDFDLHVSKVGDFLRSTDNVDVDGTGTIRRRQGTALIEALADAHSLHMTSATTGYLGVASVLYPVTIINEVVTLGTLIKILSNADPISWVESGDDLYYSNGTDSGRITAGVWYPLGITTPAAPALTLIAGSLLAGWYQVGVSFSNSMTGEESGISASSNIDLAATSGIRVTLPAATPGADTVNIYLSDANGSVVYLLTTVAAGTASYDCATLAGRKRESNGRFEEPLPAGTLFESNGRLCSFSGKAVYVGLPYRYGYYLPVEGYLLFPEDVSIAVANQFGTYLAADKTYWIPGDLGDVQDRLSTVLPYGAVPGTVFTTPNNSIVGWFGAKGIVLADPQGQAEAVMSDNIDLTPPAVGTSAVFSDRGYRRVVSCGWCVNLDTKSATHYSSWEFTSTSGEYGTKSDGLYHLNTRAPVEASLSLGKLNFGSEEFKHLPAVYVGVASETEMQLTVNYVDAHGVTQSYDYLTRGCDPELRQQRFDPGKGIRANWFELILSNTDGADFTLATVSFAPTIATRRI